MDHAPIKLDGQIVGFFIIITVHVHFLLHCGVFKKKKKSFFFTDFEVCTWWYLVPTQGRTNSFAISS